MKSRKNSTTSTKAAGSCHTSSSGGGGGGGGGNCYSSSSSKMERKDVEKNRRLHMKGLCLKLSSLIPAAAPRRHHHHYSTSSSSPPSSTKEAVTQLDHLEQAAAYIKQLKGRIDELKKRKQQAAALTTSTSNGRGGGMPVVEVRCQDGTLDVVVVSEAIGEERERERERAVRLHEVIGVLEEEGAEVVNASFSVVGDKIFYTLHSQALCSRIGLDASRVSHRLRNLLQY
ncbi:transcription factor bHLH168-like [Oryza glaberrima]|uniref:BHLH domain-containing protein n=2 Tax=Oryza TaxID=4527 RepID=A0A0D3EIR3_9ORYZ|nr:transcription factor bHLH168-like [Oryza glaberrima]